MYSSYASNLVATSKNSKSASVTRDALLEAAGRVVVAQGAEALTLQAVAQEAGVSKGGLLYHFPNKDALIAGMIQHLVDEFTAALNQELAQDDAPKTPGHWVRAYIRASAVFDQQTIALQSGLLAAIAVNPELLIPIQEIFVDWQRQIEASGIDPATATALRLAIDGLLFAHLFGLGVPKESLQEAVIETLLKLAH
ncbi:TetR family transcriptional regulator [Trichocoleus sp. FACHB-90]|nr:TetR family transcriptional regulator [Trichocoleus sp. FACHB-90]